MHTDSEADNTILKWFTTEQSHIGWMYSSFAAAICQTLVPGPERSIALRKLLESMDAAIRANKHPGG